MPEPVVLETNLDGLTKLSEGKVRDIYAVADDLLIVATDRISAYDSVMPNGIPMKGKLLTALTLFWLDTLKPENHLITADVHDMPEPVKTHADILDGRSMLVKKAEVLPIECVVRGYLAGSAQREYEQTGAVCGVALAPGLREAEKLPAAIFTPATKAESGHDENITFARVVETVGEEIAERIRGNTLDLYAAAAKIARARGVIICDTKFEWGLYDGKIILIDEMLTPDSSRFWPLKDYQPGRPQPSFDKQFVRDWLTRSGWNKEPPAPALPEEVVRKTSEKYQQVYELLTGKRL